MKTWQRDFDWSNRYLDAIRNIVGPRLLQPASLEQDRQEATDMVVLMGKDMRIACRVRRPEYRKLQYMRQFTLRSWRASGVQTDLDKIISGWGDWMFYGFATDATTINPWIIVNLHSFREHLIRHVKYNPPLRTGTQSNNDGTTKFRWYDIDSFPGEPPLLIAEERAQESKPVNVPGQELLF